MLDGLVYFSLCLTPAEALTIRGLFLSCPNSTELPSSQINLKIRRVRVVTVFNRVLCVKAIKYFTSQTFFKSVVQNWKDSRINSTGVKVEISTQVLDTSSLLTIRPLGIFSMDSSLGSEFWLRSFLSWLSILKEGGSCLLFSFILSTKN